MLEPDLEASDILFSLFQESEWSGKVAEALVGWARRIGHSGGAGSDQHGIEPVVLGPASMLAGVSLDLDRLQNNHGEAGGAEMFDDAALVAAASLDPDALDPAFSQPRGELLPAEPIIGHLPMLATAVNGDVEFVLGRIDPGRRYDSLAHSSSTPAL